MKKHLRSLFHKFWLHLPFVFFISAVLCLCFVYGVAVGKWHIFPYGFLNAGWDSLKELRKKPNKPLYHVHPARYNKEGVVVYEHEKSFPGVTLIAGSWKEDEDWTLGIRLIDLNGKILQQWQTNPRDIWEQSPHKDYITGAHDEKRKTCVHGTQLLSNGDVVFNLEYFGLVRMNSDSDVVWKLPYRTHHSIFFDDGGNLWVCGMKIHEKNVEEYIGLKPPFFEDTILKVSTEGVIEREISVLEVIYKSGYYSLINNSQRNTDDILHLNDIDVLSEDCADNFNLFQAGDIMISLYYQSTLLVIDAKTERIKWSMTGPFIGQHDPDFTKDGFITVFDNYSDKLGGSRILRIEPLTREITILYGNRQGQYFYTQFCGKHQHLPNGNMIITESYAGRVFEITANGEVVWDWITPRWDENNVSEILEGTRYDSEFADFPNKSRKDDK